MVQGWGAAEGVFQKPHGKEKESILYVFLF